MCQAKTQKGAAADFQKAIASLEALSYRTSVHCKKFGAVVRQLRAFVDKYEAEATDNNLTTDEQLGTNGMTSIINEYMDMFEGYGSDCWVHAVLLNKGTYVYDKIVKLVQRTKQTVEMFDKAYGVSFDAEAREWKQLQVLDVKAIVASLRQHLQKDPSDVVMIGKLNSLDQCVAASATDDPNPGARISSPIPISYQKWRLTSADFEKGDNIGSGVSALVYKGRDLRDGKEIAIKELKFKKLSGQRLRSFQREVSILATLKHPTILGFVGATDVEPFCIVTDWMGGGSLYEEIHGLHKLTPIQLTKCAIDIARSLKFMASKNLIHRDVKSLNVLLSSDGRAKLCDFGVSRTKGKEGMMTHGIGTAHWMAPELLLGNAMYDGKVDVYAFGIVLWEMETMSIPYIGLEPAQIITRVLLNNERPALPESMDPALKTLIEDCWATDPDDRPTFREIIRRMRDERIVLQKASEDEAADFMDEEVSDDDDIMEQDGESEEKPDQDLERFYEILCNGIESDVVDKCWENLLSMPVTRDTETFAKCAALFLRTRFASDASAVLRQCAPGVISFELGASLCEMIPTGNELVDTNIIVIACRCGATTEAFTHAIHDEHKKLAVEVIAATGLKDSSDTGPVCETCVRCMESDDDMLIVACIRCLTTLNQLDRIAPITLVRLLRSNNPALRISTYVLAGDMLERGMILPNEVVEMAINDANILTIAGSVLIRACAELSSAGYVASRARDGMTLPNSIWTAVLLQSSRHETLKPDLRQAWKCTPIIAADDSTQKALDVLNKVLL